MSKPSWDLPQAACQFVADEDFNPEDVCFLKGIQVPGTSHVRVKRHRGVDTRQQVVKMATITFLAYKPAEVVIRTTMWTDEHLEALAGLLKAIEPSASEKVTEIDNMLGTMDQAKAPKPIEIRHPITQLRGISNVFIFEIDGPERQHDGTHVLTIKAAEWWKTTTKGGTIKEPEGAERSDSKDLRSAPFHPPPSRTPPNP